MPAFEDSASRRPSRVLLVDDEEDYRIIVADVLGAAGMEVRAEEDGAAGLAALEGFDADVALVDWLMPRMDGETFCRAIRADPRRRGMPILMLTVRRTADEELDALHFGVDDFLVKPFAPEELLARVRALLRAKTAEPNHLQ